jgi:hypothetical protein
VGDILYLADEQPQPQDGVVSYAGRGELGFLVALEGVASHEDLLVPVMRGGRRLLPSPSLAALRSQAASQVASLPAERRRLRNPEIYHVGLSPALARMKADLISHSPGIMGWSAAAGDGRSTAGESTRR